MDDPLPYELAYIQWADASGPTGRAWSPVAELQPRLHEVHSVGWVVKESDEAVVMITHVTDDCGEELADNYMVIAKAMIRQRRVLWLREDDPVVR